MWQQAQGHEVDGLSGLTRKRTLACIFCSVTLSDPAKKAEFAHPSLQPAFNHARTKQQLFDFYTYSISGADWHRFCKNGMTQLHLIQ